MAYVHTPVKKIEAATARHKEHAETMDAQSLATLQAHTADLDGLRLRKTAAEFAAAVSKIYRGAKFGITRDCPTEWLHGLNVLSGVWVYLPGHEYPLCMIGHADTTLNHSGPKYFVASRTIRNDKFAEDRKQYNMAMSDNLERAIKNVKKYVRPYTPVEIAGMSYDDFHRTVNERAWTSSSSAGSAARAVLEGDALRGELFSLLVKNYEFDNPVLREKIVAWQDAWQADAAERARAVHAYHVRARTHGDEQVFDVIEVFDVRSSAFKGDARVQTFKQEDLPEDIAAKLASLSMLENSASVDGLGMKVNATTYWVERT